MSLTHTNMNNLIGRSGVHIFINLKRERKILRINNHFATRVAGM